MWTSEVTAPPIRQLHALATIFAGKTSIHSPSPLSVYFEFGWAPAPELVWMLWRRGKYITMPGIDKRNLGRPTA